MRRAKNHRTHTRRQETSFKMIKSEGFSSQTRWSDRGVIRR